MNEAYRYLNLLEPDGTIRPVANDDEARIAASSANIRIGKDQAGGYEVSTVFLNVERHGGMWFETMLFGDGDQDGVGWRYATKVEAVAGHAAIVDALNAGTNPNDAVQS